MITQQEYMPTSKDTYFDPNWPYTNKKPEAPPTGVWVAYSNSGTLFESDMLVVMFDSEVAALRFAVKDGSRIIKVVFVPFGKPLADYLV